MILLSLNYTIFSIICIKTSARLLSSNCISRSSSVHRIKPNTYFLAFRVNSVQFKSRYEHSGQCEHTIMLSQRLTIKVFPLKIKKKIIKKKVIILYSKSKLVYTQHGVSKALSSNKKFHLKRILVKY